jgi:hypothetical protein
MQRQKRQNSGKKGSPENAKLARDTPQRRFLRALSEGLHVCEAVKAARVSRSTVYRWKDEDSAFAEAWTDAQETMLDNVENAIYHAALQGNVTAQIFILKTQGKARGWIERQSLDVQQTLTDTRPFAEIARERAAAFDWDGFRQELDHQIARAAGVYDETTVKTGAVIALMESGISPPPELTADHAVRENAMGYLGKVIRSEDAAP